MAILAECLCHKKQSLRNKVCSCGEDLVKLKRANKVSYWIAYRLHGGKQKFEKITGENANSIEYAKDVESKRKVQKRENRIFDIKPEATMTFNELTKWYLDLEKVKGLSYYWVIGLSLKKFDSVFGNTVVQDIKPSMLENYQAKRKAEGKADSTIDQEIGAARAMINKAFKDDLVGGVTLKAFQSVKKLLKRNANARNKILTKEQFDNLLDKLPLHAKGILATAFYTGMRLREITSLTWDRVDLKERFICLEREHTKDKEPRRISISPTLLTMFSRIPRSLHDNHVFLLRGKPIKDMRGALTRACRDAGIPYGRFLKDGFVFHDLRHSFNTHMRKAGVPESVIMKVTGHSTREMFDRYNTVDMDDAKEAMRKLEGYFASVDQTVYQAPVFKEKGLTGNQLTP